MPKGPWYRRLVWRIPLTTLAFVGLAALVSGAGGAYSYGALVAERQEASLRQHTRLEARRLRTALAELEHDVSLVARLASRDVTSEVVVALCVELLHSKPAYEQVRVLDPDGRELLRTERTPGAAGAIRLVPQEELQDKRERAYVQAAREVPPGRLYLSDLNLNREHGAIQLPAHPTLRAVMAVRDGQGAPVALAMINLDVNEFLGRLFSERAERHVLLNERGDYLWTARPDWAFAWELGEPVRFPAQHPELADLFGAEPGLQRTAGLLRGPEDLLWLERVDPFADARFWVLGVSAPRSELSAGMERVALGGALLSLALVGLAALAAFAGARRTVEPLARITAAAKRVGQGERAPELPTERDDELGVLARALRAMLETVGENEDRLRVHAERLERANRDLEAFVHVATHDLREPARRVAASADMLLLDEQERLSPDGQRLLAVVRDSAQRSLELITGVRSLAQADSADSERAPVDLEALVDRCLAVHREEFDARDVTVRRLALPELRLFPQLVELLYSNLVRNALRHGTPGGELEISAERRPGGWLLRVSNTAQGVDPEELPRLFDPFHGAGPTAGTGLGLAICRRVAERHEGEISARVEGDRFIVEVCLEEGA